MRSFAPSAFFRMIICVCLKRGSSLAAFIKRRLRLPLLPVLPAQEMPRPPLLLPGRYDVCRVAESLELFEYAPGVRDANNLGAWWLENKLDCSLPYEIDEFFDYAGYGESIAENNDDEFVKGLGFVCMEEGYTLEDVLQDTDQGMGGM